MAMTLGDIVVNIKSDTSQLTKGFKRAESAVSKSARTMSTAIKTITAAYIGLNAIDLVGNLVKQADTMTLVNTRLKLATKSTEELVEAQKELFDISQEARVGFSSTVDLFERITRSTRDYATSQTEIIGLTETINKAMVISGGTAQSMNAAIIQLGQAFSADFQSVGQELASIREQSPRLYQALLEGTELSSKAFKKHAEDGKLSTQIIIEALKSQSEAVESEFKKVNLTVDQSQTQFRNSSLKIVGSIDEITGASRFIAESISDISKSMDELEPENIEEIARQIKLVSITIIATTIAIKGYTTASALAISANALLGGSFGAVNRAILLTTVSSKALTLAMRAIPIVAIAGSIALLVDSLLDSAKASDELEESLSKTGKKLSELTDNQLAYRKVVLDESLHDALMARQRAVVDASHQGFLESDKEHALDLKNKDEAIAKFREIRNAIIEVNKAIRNRVVDPSAIATGAGGGNDIKTFDTKELDKAGTEFAKKNADERVSYDTKVTTDFLSWKQKAIEKNVETDTKNAEIFEAQRQKAFEDSLKIEQTESEKMWENVGDIAKNNIAGALQAGMDGDLDMTAFISQLSKSIGQAMLMGGNIALGLGVMAVGSLLGQDNQSTSERAEEEFNAFMDGLNSASEALENFGNIGTSVENQIETLQESILKNQELSAIAENELAPNVAKKYDLIAESLSNELTSIINESLADTLDLSVLSTEQLTGLTSGIDIEAMQALDTELNNIALSMKTGTESAEDIARATDILSDAEFARFKDNEEAFDILNEKEEERLEALEASAQLQADITKQVNDEMLGSLSYLSDLEKLSLASNIFDTATTPEDRISSSRAIAEISRGTTRTKEEFIPDFQRYITEIENQADEATTQDVVDKLDEVIVALDSIESSATENAIYA